MRRTLLTAAVFAFVAAIFVPCTRFEPYEVSRVYLPIFGWEAHVEPNYGQLALNVAFMALAGAILANLSRRALKWTLISGAILLVIWSVNAIVQYRQDAIARAVHDEKYADQVWRENHVEAAKALLLNAADNWRIAWRSDQEKRLREKERNLSPPPWGKYDDLIPAAKKLDLELITPSPNRK